jgi:hypothetical protein
MDKQFSINKEALKIAVQAALEGDWHKSHNIAQDYTNDTANWIHAVLHKIEGDESNSKYWYARTANNSKNAKKFADFADAKAELKAILNDLNNADNI